MDFKLEIHEVNTVLQGLGELPARVSMELITLIQQQAASQMQPLTAPIEEEQKEGNKNE